MSLVRLDFTGTHHSMMVAQRLLTTVSSTRERLAQLRNTAMTAPSMNIKSIELMFLLKPHLLLLMT